ncbi:MAG TPA: DUF3500 domain-containing protein [Bryobacteraceae bacterium]|nr:DUF3500 domain-containing protein [Bryobacteraceae bacterium]
MKRRILYVASAVTVAAICQGPAGDIVERFRARSIEAEKKGLAEPFKGVTTNGEVVPGLFGIKSTGVTTEPARKAAEAFLSALTPEQRSKTTFDIDDPEWRKWMNQHFYVRQGVSFKEMSEAQREAAISMLRASLSAKGLQLTRDIMRLNHTLGELTNNFVEYGEYFYHITVMGQPSKTEPWGWQLEGHHLLVNYFVLGDQVVMTPMFVGSEPVIAKEGKYKGTMILQDEQKLGLALINGLSEAQQAKAILEREKKRNNNQSEAWKDNVVIPYAGLPVSEMNAQQQKQLLQVVEAYVGNMSAGHAKIRMDEIRGQLDKTYFAWVGGTAPGSIFYYRIHSPVVLIEFDHQSAAGLRNVVPNPNLPNHEHVHAVMRTPNGNDYGKDLLRQHLAKHPHPHTH